MIAYGSVRAAHLRVIERLGRPVPFLYYGSALIMRLTWDDVANLRVGAENAERDFQGGKS